MEFMQFINQWSNRLIHFLSMQVCFSVILFVVIITLIRFLKVRSRFLMAGLWSLVFIRLLLPLEWSHGFSGRKILEYFLRVPISVEHVSLFHLSSNTAHPVFGETLVESHEFQLLSFNMILTGLWVVGVLVLFTLYIKRVCGYHRMIRKSEPCKDPILLRIVDSWRREFGIRQSVKLVTGNFHKPPFTIGLFRPVIYIPQLFCEKSNMATLESVIAHEMVHIKHRDDGWLCLQNLIQIVYFFNPVVWLAGMQLAQVREQLCDAVVLSRKRLDGHAYGNGLLNMIQLNLASDGFCPIPTFAGEKRRLAERIRCIAMTQDFNRKHVIISTLLLFAMGLILLPMGASSIGNVKLISPCTGGYIALEYGKDWNRVTQQYYDHTGIDIQNSEKPGQIVAAADGKVISAGQDEIFKGCREITIQHAEGLQTRYLHVSRLFVEPGDRVKQGELIGHVAFCLHFEVYENGKLQDPEDFVTLEKKLIRIVTKG